MQSIRSVLPIELVLQQLERVTSNQTSNFQRCDRCVPLPRFWRIEIVLIGIISGEHHIPWFLLIKEILKGINIPWIMETATKLVSKVHSSVVSHADPGISTLAWFQSMTNNRCIRPCHLFDWNDEHSLIFTLHCTPKKATWFFPLFSFSMNFKVATIDWYFGSSVLVGRSLPYFRGTRKSNTTRKVPDLLVQRFIELCFKKKF